MRNRKNKSDTHIRILQFVFENESPVSIEQISNNLQLEVDELDWLNNECDTGTRVFLRNGRNEQGHWLLSLSMIGRQILLEHESLESARKSSLIATWIAVAALFAAIISVVMTYLSLRC